MALEAAGGEIVAIEGDIDVANSVIAVKLGRQAIGQPGAAGNKRRPALRHVMAGAICAFNAANNCSASGRL